MSIYCGINNAEPDRGARTESQREKSKRRQQLKENEIKRSSTRTRTSRKQEQQQEQLNGTKRAQAKRCNGSESQSKSVWSGILGPSVEKVLF